MKAPDGESLLNTMEGVSFSDLDDASKILSDGIQAVEDAGLDLSCPLAFWVNDVPYMVQKITVHESH